MRGRLLELARSKLAYSGVAADPEIAHRWEALRDLPAGSWGRGVADFYERHGFPFPGEEHGIYEIGARHGIECPTVRRLVAMIHEVENGTRALNDDNLLELLPR